MDNPSYSYQAMLTEPGSDEVTSLIAYRDTSKGFEAIIWHATKQKWVWAPGTVISLLCDDEYANESKPVDRETAERLANRYLPEPLPPPERIQEMVEEGQRSDQNPLPPRR